MKKNYIIIVLLCLVKIVNAAPNFLLAGDSTVANYPAERLPLCGWGQALKEFVQNGSEVYNFAQSGASSKSFRDSGHWDRLLSALKEGDVVLIQFGHNDAVTDPAKHTKPYTEYSKNLTFFIESVRARNAYPILCTPIAYRSFENAWTIKNLHNDYPDAVKKVAEKEKVPCIDLTAISTEIYLRYGQEKSKSLFKYCLPGEYPAFLEGASDDCHLNPNGAREIAHAITREFHRHKLAAYRQLKKPVWQIDFKDAAIGELPAPWIYWAKDNLGQAFVAESQGEKYLQIQKAEALSLQYDIPAKPDEKYLIEVEYELVGSAEVNLRAAWKAENRAWTHWQKPVDGSPQPTVNSIKKNRLLVTVPKEVEFLCAMVSIEKQTNASDLVKLKKLRIEQHFAGSVLFPENDPAPVLGLTKEKHQYPVYSSNAEVLKNLRMAVIKHNEIIGDENNHWVTPESVAQVAREIKEAGFNCIITEGQRFLMRDLQKYSGYLDVTKGSLLFPQLVKNTKTIVEAFHNEGLKVYFHLTSGLAPEEFYTVHPTWMIKSVLDNENRRYWGLNWLCQNNEEYTREYEKRLEELIKEARPDGLMIDETSNMYDSCGCRDCRKRFTAETGLIMPAAGNNSWFENLDSQIYRAFLRWRVECTKKKNLRHRQILRKHIPEGVLLGYYAVPYNEKTWYEHGVSLEASAELDEIFGLETISNYSKYWALFIANMKLTRYVAEKQLGTAFTITAFPDFDVLYACWLLNLSQGGHQYWSWYQSKEIKERRKDLILWEMKYEKLFSALQSVSEVGVVFSSLDMNLRRNPRGKIKQQNLFFAITNTLSLQQIPYQINGDLDLEKALPDSVKTLVAMDLGLMSEKTHKNIRDFVKRGGKLIASGEFSLYDEEGDQLSNFALADLLGCDFVALPNGQTSLMKQGNTLCTMDALVEVKKHSGALEIASLASNNSPGLIYNRFGKGEVYYFSGSIAPEIYFNEMNGTRIVDRDPDSPRNEKFANFLSDLIHPNEKEVICENLPKGVIVEKFRQNGITQINLLNFSGMITEGRPETGHFNFSELENASISIPAIPCQKVFAYSPEFNVKKELNFANNENRLTVELPTFKSLLILRFE